MSYTLHTALAGIRLCSKVTKWNSIPVRHTLFAPSALATAVTHSPMGPSPCHQHSMPEAHARPATGVQPNRQWLYTCAFLETDVFWQSDIKDNLCYVAVRSNKKTSWYQARQITYNCETPIYCPLQYYERDLTNYMYPAINPVKFCLNITYFSDPYTIEDISSGLLCSPEKIHMTTYIFLKIVVNAS